jgi:hypothetical protein
MDMEVDALEPESATSDGGAKSLSPACNADYADTPQSSSADLHPADETVNGCAAEGPTADDFDPSAEPRFEFREVKEFIEACTAPQLVSAKWSFLDEEHTRLRIEMQPSEFVAVLEEEYGTEFVTRLGLYKRVADELRLPDWLDDEVGLYVMFDVHKCRVEFFRDNEFLFPMRCTARDYARERNPAESNQVPTILYVVATADDADIMRRVGLPAVTSDGFETLNADDVQRLFSGDARSDWEWRFEMLLLDFDVAGLVNQPTAGIGEVINCLADAADVYTIDPARRFGLCRPTADEFHLLERAIKFKDRARICRLFEEWSAGAMSERIDNWRTQIETHVVSFAAARAALHRALQLKDIVRHCAVSEALPVYRAACREMVDKFNNAIDLGSNPFDQMNLIAAGAHAEIFFDSDPLVLAAEAVLSGQTPSSARELHEQVFKQRSACLAELRRSWRNLKPKR